MMRSTSRTHVALAGWASAFERHHMIEIAPAGRRRTPWIRAALIACQNQVDEPPVRAVTTGRRGCVTDRITTSVFGQIALSRAWWIDHDDPISIRCDSSSLVSRYRAVAHKQSRLLASSCNVASVIVTITCAPLPFFKGREGRHQARTWPGFIAARPNSSILLCRASS